VPTHKIDDLLDEGHSRFTPLQRLLTTSSNQKQWTAELRALIEPPLRYEVEITQIRGPVATILCHSSAAATRLRFLMPEILPRMQSLSSFSSVKDCQLRVSPQGASP
jgi:hypothetical protein